MPSDKYSRRIGTKCEQNPHGPQISVPHGWARGGVRRPRALALGRPAVGNCGLQVRNRRGRFSAAPVRGLGKRSPQRPVAGRFVRFSPTGDGRGRGWWAPGRPAVENCGLHLRNRQARLGAAPVRGLGKRSPQLPVAGRSVRFPPTGGGAAEGQCGSEAAGS